MIRDDIADSRPLERVLKDQLKDWISESLTPSRDTERTKKNCTDVEQGCEGLQYSLVRP